MKENGRKYRDCGITECNMGEFENKPSSDGKFGLIR